MLRTLTARGAGALAIAVAAIVPGAPSAAHTQRPDAVLRQMVDAVARWDIEGICERVTLAPLTEVVGDLDFVSPQSQCVLVLEEGGNDAKEILQDQIEDLRSLRTVRVRVRGNRSRVTYAYQSHDARVTAHATALLVRERRNWRVDQLQDGPPRVGRELLFQVPSASMEPALPIGAWILVDPHAYRTHAPAIGDVVVLRPPTGFGSSSNRCGATPPKGQACARARRGVVATYIPRRIVGLPGDRIAIRHGRVVRNGVPERSGPAKPCGGRRACELPRPFTVPRGAYYVMGDNRGSSDDSRAWGPVPQRSILGRARVIRR